MEIKAIRMFDGGFMNQPFAFGGEEGKDMFDEQIINRSSLQNFLIDMGDKPEQVTKILITHKHPDHTGVIKNFPNAKIYISPEDAGAMKLEGENIVRAEYKESYKNFPRAQKITDGIWFIEAKGHTKGNSIIIAEDKDAARETLDRVCVFIQQNPTVYLSTHCPEGYENLDMKRVMKL